MGKRCLIHDLFIYLLPLILQTILPRAIAHLTWNRFVFYRATRIWIDHFPPTSSQLNDMWYRFQIDIICVIETLIPLISWNFIVTVHCVFVWEKWTVFGRHLFKQIPCDLVNRYGVLWTEMIYWCHRIQVHHAMHSSSSWKWAGIRLVPNFVIWWAFTCGYNVFWFTVT